MDDGKVAFAKLRPLCTKLLELPATGERAANVLEPLAEVLKNLPAGGLQTCLDYVLFPLLLLLDAAVASRTQKENQKAASSMNVGDKLAEGVVSCLNIVLQRCSFTEVQKLTMLLRKLVAAAMLRSENASEEFRHGVVICLKTLFQTLKECSNCSCCCHSVALAPFFTRKNGILELKPSCADCFDMEDTKQCHLMQQPECALGALQSEEMAAAIGHLASVLFEISHSEAAKAGVGSGALRADSLLTIRILITKVGAADALAFFLPGVASGFGKAIRCARLAKHKSTSSVPIQFYNVGAAGSSRALEEAIQGIANLFVLVLADVHTTWVAEERIPVEDALAALQDLSSSKFRGIQEAEFKQEQLQIEAYGKDRDSAEQGRRSMRIERSGEWLLETVRRINTLLEDVFPPLCAHPSAAVRFALVNAIGYIVTACHRTLKCSASLLVECLLALACDDYGLVAGAARNYLLLISSAYDGAGLKEVLNEVSKRLLEALPRTLLTADDTVALLHSRRLAAAMYFSGPDGVYSSFFQSPVSISEFVRIMTQSLSLSSTFSGRLKLNSQAMVNSGSYKLEQYSKIERDTGSNAQEREKLAVNDRLPRVPFWFAQAGKSKLYHSLSNVLRLAGFSSLTGRGVLADIVEPLLCIVRKCAVNSSNKGSTDCGQSRRLAAAAACVLNEIIYGASGIWIARLSDMFGKNSAEPWQSCSHFSETHRLQRDMWSSDTTVHQSSSVADSVGNILHDYMVPELWDLPVDMEFLDSEDDESVHHLLQDNITLLQILVEGIGIFAMSMGKQFEKNGYLGLVIYPLLEKLGCSIYALFHAASISLYTICFHCGYDSVRNLVVSNADHIIDSLCRQLRHISLYPHAPSLIAAILQQTGAAADLLPLLEEPMRGMLLEIEIPGRHFHPSFTVPILKALREIMKAAKHGSIAISEEACKEADTAGTEGEWKLRDRIKCHHSVLSLATSCLVACAPLLASKNLQTCILTLDVVENGISALAKTEAACKEDKKELDALQTEDDDSELGGCTANDVNKLLPTMHQLWPHLVLCLKQTHPSVIVKCLHVIAAVTYECGGEFFARRFQKDALPYFLRLLKYGVNSSSNNNSNSNSRISESKTGILQQMLSSSQPVTSSLSSAAPTANLRVQEAVVKCVKSISESTKSAAALESIFDTVAGSMVCIACSLHPLKQLAVETVVAMAVNMDADVMWSLVADLAYGLYTNTKVNNSKQPHLLLHLNPPTAEFPKCEDILPPLSTMKDALCVQYAGHEFGFKFDITAACELLKRLESA